ncbi:MAG TPA: biotin carboxylase N-terminal domain-containing protein, partial [Candidatus Nanopelagicales bacterium]|nr:biotin carboxylase N-terminal domain-containing protein [Candidatus Nanopelagicales bacterium]
MADIRRLLVANRGEIARRVLRTAAVLGIETVAVFSEPDRGLPFVDEATYAVPLGGTTSAESYLSVEKVLEAARRTGADAVHPGYGFLSENPAFAEAVTDAGLVWVGPTPDSMRAMALKVEAKRIAAAAGVPLVPGAELAPDVTDSDLLATGEQVGYPLLVKASAGGGGKGMRVVRASSDLLDAVAGARREAASSFGDPTVFLERYLERSRHVEVQVFGDVHGSVVHLFERECSIQRRHQKVVEESPSPGASPAVVDRMHAAAVSLARAIDYVGAGTVEFLVSGDGDAQEFFFLEMNTRLQVEHPVTELVTGLDLVEWQLRVAQGEPLPLGQDEIEREGHAIEVRLYAEDPANGYLPSTGRITRWELGFAGDVRVDAAVTDGSEVTPYYDPMLAKVVAHARERSEAASVLARALRDERVDGVVTNAEMLVAVLESEPFLDGATTTAFLDEHPGLLVPQAPDDVVRRHLVAAGCLLLGSARASIAGASPRGWRNVAGAPSMLLLSYRRGAILATAQIGHAWTRGGDVLWLCPSLDGAPAPAQTLDTDPRFERIERALLEKPAHRRGTPWFLEEQARLELDGVRTSISLDVGDAVLGDSGAGALDDEPSRVVVSSDGWSTAFVVVEPWAASAHEASGGGPTTPVPGTVTHVAVAVGDAVEAGAALVVLEAMKMEHTIRADVDGVVTGIHVAVGQSVDAHTLVV